MVSPVLSESHKQMPVTPPALSILALTTWCIRSNATKGLSEIISARVEKVSVVTKEMYTGIDIVSVVTV